MRWLLVCLWMSGCAAEARLPFEGGPGSDPPWASAEGGQGWNDACHAESVTLAEIHSGLVKLGRPLTVRGLVASSRKFLLSQAQSGSCLWGAFAAGEGLAGAGSGLLLVSFGAEHAEGQLCAPGTDGLPDGLEPGDALVVQGALDEYAPAACPGVTPAWQLRVDGACPVRRVGRDSPLQPSELDAALATRLAAGREPRLLQDWGGALVELRDVSALRDEADGDAVFDYGVVRLAESTLEVHSRLYYYDLRAGGPGAAGKAPRLAYPVHFERLVGLIFLEHCRWVLGPRDFSADMLTSQGRAPRGQSGEPGGSAG
jgi:hypothetical protein